MFVMISSESERISQAFISAPPGHMFSLMERAFYLNLTLIAMIEEAGPGIVL
jgi:hypothetical protein